jgi:hypothetical protein
LTGIDGVTAARPQDPPTSLDQPVLDDLALFTAEFFVEWQVADRAPTIEVAAGEK